MHFSTMATQNLIMKLVRWPIKISVWPAKPKVLFSALRSVAVYQQRLSLEDCISDATIQMCSLAGLFFGKRVDKNTENEGLAMSIVGQSLEHNRMRIA